MEAQNRLSIFEGRNRNDVGIKREDQKGRRKDLLFLLLPKV